MQVQEFIKGKQTKGTFVFDKTGNVMEVLKDIANAKAWPIAGAYYRLVMAADEYAKMLTPEKPLDYAAAVKLCAESTTIPADQKRILSFLLEEVQKKAGLKDSKVDPKHLPNYHAEVQGSKVVFKKITDEEAAKESASQEAETGYTPAKVGMHLPAGANGSLLVPMPFTGTVRLWDGVTAWSSFCDVISDKTGKVVAAIPGTNTWLNSKTAVKAGGSLLITILGTQIIGSDKDTLELMFTLPRPNKKLVFGTNPNDSVHPIGITQKGFIS